MPFRRNFIHLFYNVLDTFCFNLVVLFGGTTPLCELINMLFFKKTKQKNSMFLLIVLLIIISCFWIMTLFSNTKNLIGVTSIYRCDYCSKCMYLVYAFWPLFFSITSLKGNIYSALCWHEAILIFSGHHLFYFISMQIGYLLLSSYYLDKAYDRMPGEELWYCMWKTGVATKYLMVV